MRGLPTSGMCQGLRDLIADLKDTNLVMVEIGSYAGQSTEIFADSGKFSKVYAVDPWIQNYDISDPGATIFDMTAVETEFDNVAAAYPNIIVKIKMTSLFASTTWNTPLDLVYLDGNHQYNAVCSDIRVYLPLLKNNGAIAGHDYSHWKDTVGKAVDDMLGKPDKLYQDGSWIKWLPR